jgi:hypothetical protein
VPTEVGRGWLTGAPIAAGSPAFPFLPEFVVQEFAKSAIPPKRTAARAGERRVFNQSIRVDFSAVRFASLIKIYKHATHKCNLC